MFSKSIKKMNNHTIVTHGTIELRNALLGKNEVLVRQILDSANNGLIQVDASYQDEITGESLLMIASRLGLNDSVTALLTSGAPWNAIDRHGKCAGEYALANGHQAIVDALVTAGVSAELVFGEMSRTEMAAAPRNLDYLQSQAKYEGDLIQENTRDAVMMEWERPLMEAHAAALCSGGSAKSVLNVGFGMGIIDEYFQQFSPAKHVISEAHPDVLKEMKRRGWDQRPNVFIAEGRWQDKINDIIRFGPYDAVFFDTFGEHLDDLREFHRFLPQLISQDGTYSFFNGMCPNNIFFQGVACEVVRLDLKNLGFDCEFHHIDVDSGGDEVWAAVARRYFSSNDYYMPLAKRSVGGGQEEVHRRDRKRVIDT
jgi:protein arginine N-methyltransferase 2